MDLDPSLTEALEILSKTPFIDGHNDWMHLIRGYYDNKLDERFEPQRNLAGHVDLKRLVQGKLGGAFWSVYVDCPQEDNFADDAIHFEAVRDTLQQIDVLLRIVDLYSDNMAMVHCSDDIMKIFNEGKCASLIGVEGLHQIGNSASILRIYHKLGVRYVTLAHSKNNLYADSATSAAPDHHGLSDEGKVLIREMNRIGMVIDLSHTSEAAMLAAIEISAAPVIFSHSSVYGIVPHPRNVPDHLLDKLKNNGGIIMISFIPNLTNKNGAVADIDHLIDHIIYVGERIGYDHLGLGSDYDGMVKAVTGLEDVSKLPWLVMRMRSRGISRQDVEKVIGLNVIRVLRAVEDVAKSLSGGSALEDKVKQLWGPNMRDFVMQEYPDAEPHEGARRQEDTARERSGS